MSRITIERQTYGLRLRIRNLTRTDQGMWECLGSDQDGRPLSRTLQLNVKGKFVDRYRIMENYYFTSSSNHIFR